MLTRPQFDAACKALINKYAGSTATSATSPLERWLWNEHPRYLKFGYLSRTVDVFRQPGSSVYRPDDGLGEILFEESDQSVVSAASESHEALYCRQYVVFSQTFKVPAFYFTVCDSSGAPLSLPDIVKTSLFKVGACEGVEVSPSAISLPTTVFPLLSHGDHPTLGTPCWYFHPCETMAVVEELMEEAREDGWDEETMLIRWMELWFMVVCTVVNL